MVRAENVHKRFGSLHVLRGVSMTVQRGEVVAVIGSSGSGKSTFLRCLNNLETIDGGNIDIAGESLAQTGADGHVIYPPDREIRRICSHTGMVFQHFNLFPHMTVLQNLIEAPITVRRKKKDAVIPRAMALLEKVGLADKRDTYPAHLSGGQKQRVAIARALAMEPEILLFDEPTSALDPELTGEVLKTIRELARERMTMLVITHEMAFAREVAHRVVFMGDGTILEEQPARDFFHTPRHERTRAFLANML